MNDVMIRNNGATNQDSAVQSDVNFTPRFDVWENANEYVLAGDLPGVAPEQLQLHYENRELIIQGPVAPRYKRGQPLWQEYGVGDFYRSFTISEDIDESAIAAELAGGVLTVRLPKRAEVRPRKIAVKAA
jgi:HSP20 family protein